MGHSRVVRFVAFALCLVACVSASGTGGSGILEAPVETIARAKKAVEAARTSVKGVSKEVQSSINNAEGELRKLEECKKQTEEAEQQTKEAGRDTDRAGQLANNDNRVCNTVCRLNENAKKVLQKNVANLGEVLKEAKTLDGECETELSLIKEAAEEYKDTNKNVSYLQNKVEILTTHITDILNKMNAVQCTAENMEENLKVAQLASFHVSAIVAISKIQTMIKESDIKIKKMQNERNEVKKIVQQMQTRKRTFTSQSNEGINKLCKAAEDELTKATSAVDNAKRAIGAITQQKKLADTALQNVQEAKELRKAQDEVNNAKRCVEKVKESVFQISSALDTAEIALTNAKASQQRMVKALSTTTSAQPPEEFKETAKTDLSVGDGTGTGQKDATILPTIANKEQPMGKDSLAQNDNSAEKLKDTLSIVTQNVPTTALTGGKAPAPGAKNDSAMTVSVPLLVALIASAVLQ